MFDHGPLIAAGRDAEIFECGKGLVLRRARDGRSLAAEARTMSHVHAMGYPVPAIEQVSDDGSELVMQRIDGPTMVDAIARRPWTLAPHADQLSELHRRLHALEAPDWLPAAPGAPGDRVLHLDLHPLNVLVTPSGPVVIDWPNAARGHPSTDVALTWVVTAGGTIPGNRATAAVAGAARARFIRRFLASFDRTELREHLAGVVEWKAADPNLDDAERAAIRHLARRAS